LFHAEKAVEEAEWGLKKYGDDKGVGSMLLTTTKRILEEVKARPVQADEVDEEEQEVEIQGQEDPTGESAHEQGQEGPAGEQLQAGQDDDEMLFDQFEAERGDDGMLLDQPVLDTAVPVSQAPDGANIGPGLQPEDGPKVSFTPAEVSRTTSGYTTAPSRTTSSNTTAPSRTTSSNTTVPSRTTSVSTAANTTANTESKRVDKRDRSESSNDEDKPPMKKANSLRRRRVMQMSDAAWALCELVSSVELGDEHMRLSGGGGKANVATRIATDTVLH
jgi:hypothetical protein